MNYFVRYCSVSNQLPPPHPFEILVHPRTSSISFTYFGEELISNEARKSLCVSTQSLSLNILTPLLIENAYFHLFIGIY